MDVLFSIHAGKTVPIVKGGEQTKMEENEVGLRWPRLLLNLRAYVVLSSSEMCLVRF